jgi:hypothetical protein
MAILLWSMEYDVEWHLVAPGKLETIAFLEGVYARLCDESLTSLRSQAA